MPRSGYFVCSASGSLDLYIQAVSLFNIVEMMQVQDVPQLPDGTKVIPSFKMRMTAVWLKEDTDSPEQMFKSEIVAFAPNGEQQFSAADFQPFSFGGSAVYRLVVPDFVFQFPIKLTCGFLRFECRLKRVEAADWEKRQEFSIIVQEVPPAEQQAAALPQPAEPKPEAS